jgi:hypothetical protein
MIGPGGLLLVLHHLFAVAVSVLWVGYKKVETKLGHENISAGSCTEPQLLELLLDESKVASTLYFWNVSHPLILPILKHKANIIINLNICRSQVEGGEGSCTYKSHN